MSTGSLGFHNADSVKFDKNQPDIFTHVEPEDLQRFGLIPELIGRLPMICGLHELSDEAMLDILQNPKMHSVNSTKTLQDGRC